MEPRAWFKAVVLLCVLALGSGRELKTKHAPIYDPSLARMLAEFTAAVYTSDLTQLFTWTCERCGDLTEGFEVIELIVDVKNCLQAYVGFARDMNVVIVVFRGTQENSIQNWIEDLFWKQLDFDYPGMPEAKVHSGFYSAYHNTILRDGVVGGIQKTREVYGSIPIMVTGHSMGGAMASFCALDLVINYGLTNVTLMTYGQPRIGNAVFASHFKRYLPNAIRVANAHDIVPHLPPYYQYFPRKTYHHFPREVWIHNVELGSLVYPVEEICDGSGEDPACSSSFRFLGLSEGTVCMTMYSILASACTPSHGDLAELSHTTKHCSTRWTLPATLSFQSSLIYHFISNTVHSDSRHHDFSCFAHPLCDPDELR